MHIPLCCKVTDESQVTFAVEAVAASQARDLAQEVCRWQGRVFLPLLHAVGLGSFAGELPPDKAQRPGVLVMELADSTLEKKKFEGDALIMVAWALASTLALLNEAGFSERNDDTPHPLPPPYDHLLCVQKSSAPDRSTLYSSPLFVTTSAHPFHESSLDSFLFCPSSSSPTSLASSTRMKEDPECQRSRDTAAFKTASLQVSSALRVPSHWGSSRFEGCQTQGSRA